jgi:four helix bundle protein
MAQAHQDLKVWEKAVGMTVAVYEATKDFQRDEIYGLTSQVRRAAVSVASNIAEGRGRLTQGEFRQFLSCAQGSNYEVQTQLTIARRMSFGSEDKLNEAEKASVEVGKMLSALIGSISTRS